MTRIEETTQEALYPLCGHLAARRGENLYQTVYCARGQAENLIKVHKAQLASDRTSCHSPTANQVRLASYAAYWLMLMLRDAIPAASPLAKAEFVTMRIKLIKIAAASSSTPLVFAFICQRGVQGSFALPTPP